MNNRYSLLTMLVLAACIGKAQNVGIGILSPQAKLHVFSTDNTAVLAETNTVSKYAGFEAKTNAGANDNLFVRKWMPGSSGTMAGINLDNLSQVVAGVGAGPLMIGVANNNPLYFTTNNIERMRITSGGQVGVNEMNPFGLFSVTGRLELGVTAYFRDTIASGQRGAVIAGINTTSPASAALGGATYEGGGVSTLEPVTYAVVGQSGANGYAVAGYSIGSTALRGKSTSGLALHTTGDVRMAGISEGPGKVLTSDASGNATWESLPASAGTWAVSGNNIYNTNSGNVGINTGIPSARLSIRNPSADTSAFLITHPGGFRVTRINGSRELYHEGNLWIHSAFGTIRLGYADKGWYWGTINGGQDLQLFSHSTTDVDGSRINRIYIDGTTGNVGINTNNTPAVHGKLIVDRNADMNGALGGYFGVMTGLNSSGVDGSGVYGISYAPKTGAQGYAGVSGYNASSATDRFGVIGSSSGTTAGSAYSAGVGGYGDYGVLGYSQSNTGAGMIAQHSAGKNALEINNGFIKVSGTNKTAFVHTATAGTIVPGVLYASYLNYLSPAQTDIVIVTHVYNVPGGPLNYLNSPISVWWVDNKWAIYTEDFSAITGKTFNVLVIKQ